MKYTTSSSTQTQEVAADFARRILIDFQRSSMRDGAYIIALSGELGAGKTTFTQGFLKFFNVVDRVHSPTFVLVKHFPIPNHPLITDVYHFDCYRIEGERDLRTTGFFEAIKSRSSIVLVEWPERIQEFLPPKTLWVRCAHGRDDQERIIEIPNS